MNFTPLRMLRLSAGLTANSLAQRMVPPSSEGTVNAFEAGTVKVSDEYMARYARALRISLQKVRNAAVATFRSKRKAA